MLNIIMLHENCLIVKEEQNVVLAFKKLTAKEGNSNDNLSSSYYRPIILLKALFLCSNSCHSHKKKNLYDMGTIIIPI